VLWRTGDDMLDQDIEATATRTHHRVSGALALLISILCMVAVACSDDDAGTTPSPTAQVVAATPVQAPAVADRVVVRGTLTLDALPLQAEFLGARVVLNGLPAACQAGIPAVRGGTYEIEVLAETELSGCGAPGAQIVLWTFVRDQFLFSEQTLPWPGAGETATFDTTFSPGAPLGASTRATEFKGQLLDQIGLKLPAGTVVEAFAGEIPCGVTALRPAQGNDQLYTLIVAGPETVAECAEGATLTFRLDGEEAAQTATNDLASGAAGHDLDLKIR
jgi:hypothetical protein